MFRNKETLNDMSEGEMMKNIELLPSVPYQKMYYTLFNAITDALCLMEENRPFAAIELLKRAQQQTEELYISRE